MANARAWCWVWLVALPLVGAPAFAERNTLIDDTALPPEFDLDGVDAPVRQGFFQIQFVFENAAALNDGTEPGSAFADGSASWLGQGLAEGSDSAGRQSLLLDPAAPAYGLVSAPAPGLANDGDTDSDSGAVNVRGGVGLDWGRDRIAIPLTHRQGRVDNGQYRRYDAFGLEWQRRLDASSLVSLSAEFGDFVSLDAGARDTASTAAALGWRGEFSGTTRPQLAGSIYLGDEVPKDDAQRFFGRRYYGFVLDGRFTPIHNHTPYASLRFQRSDYDADDPSALITRREDFSRLAAGWDWQVMPNWGLRAEANYSLNDSNLDTYEFDRMQFFFSTRFDFR